MQIKYKHVLSYETTKQREVKNNFLNFYGPGDMKYERREKHKKGLTKVNLIQVLIRLGALGIISSALLSGRDTSTPALCRPPLEES